MRTHNLETSLRLLSQGASPNYSHPEKNGSTSLHIACKSGQAGQAELLLVYGSDPGAVDNNGRTPSDYAKYVWIFWPILIVLKYLIFGFRTAGFHAIAQRVSHSLYEVSDRLSFFLCQRRPDHNSGQHFLVPDLNKPRYAHIKKILGFRKPNQYFSFFSSVMRPKSPKGSCRC